MDEDLPENRQHHAQDVSFTLSDAGCRPAGCCKNTGCDKIKNATDIPNQVHQCSKNLPTGCYFYARAAANITGSLCREEDSRQSIWRYPSGAAFDMMDLNGWAIPSYTLWRFHNVASSGCDKITIGAQANVLNKDLRAIRPCDWPSSEESEMLIESNGAPMSAFSSATIGLGEPNSSVPVTLRLRSLDRTSCKFTLNQYFKFPLLEVPLQLLVTSSKAISDYVSNAVNITLHEEHRPGLEALGGRTGGKTGGSSGGRLKLGATQKAEDDSLGALTEKYGKSEIIKLYYKYLTTHTPRAQSRTIRTADRPGAGSGFGPSAGPGGGAVRFNVPNHWPPINWAWPGIGAGLYSANAENRNLNFSFLGAILFIFIILKNAI